MPRDPYPGSVGSAWTDFEAAAPYLAAEGRRLVESFRFVLLGTIRRDGTPRISPVEAHVIRGHLVLVMIPATLKARDVLRDPRIVLNSPVTHPGDLNDEFKLRGRAVEITEPELRQEAAETIQMASGWRPPADWHVFSVAVEEAAFLEWRGGILRLTRWDRVHGVRVDERPTAVIEP